MFFKKKAIKLEAYAPVGDLIDFFPIVKTRNALPDWFHNIPKNNHNTVRNCYGLRDLYSQGFMVPSWGEFDITINPDGRADVDSPVTHPSGTYSQHNVTAEAPNAWPAYTNVKLHNPWWFYCSEPIQWLLIDPTWNKHNPSSWIVPPGSVEFRYNNQANINTLFKIQDRQYLTKIKPGESLMQMIPITEQPVEIELHVMTDEIYVKKFAGWAHSFKLGYHKIRAMMEKKK